MTGPDALFYVVIFMLAFEFCLHAIVERIDKNQQKDYRNNRIMNISPSRTLIFLAPFIGLLPGLLVAALCGCKFGWPGLTISMVVTCLFTIVILGHDLMWVHFYDDRIVAIRAWWGSPQTIKIAEMTRTGYKRFISSRHNYYFIEFSKGEKMRTLSVHETPEDGSFQTYFEERGVVYVNIEG